jgi:LuxR family maltose regulon positive regulatory protein
MKVEAAVVVREEVIAQQVRVCLAGKKPTEAEALLQAEGFSFAGAFSMPDSAPGAIPGVLHRAALRVLLHRVRVRSEQTSLQAGLDLADSLIEEARRRRLLPDELELLLLRSQLQAAAENASAAREDLLSALTLGSEEGYISAYVEEGESIGDALAGLLREKAHADVSPEYLRKILDGFAAIPESRKSESGAMIAQLTGRELEVLRLLAQGLRYDEVAERLVISLNTVRSHVKAIYGKLGVDNRTRAIEIAQRSQAV